MAPAGKITSEILTVMFIDLVGYTQTTERLDREHISEVHDVFDSLALPAFKKYNGKVLKKIGDAFLITFKSPTDAVLCGVELQNTFERFNRDYQPQYPLHIRVALHTGEVLLKEGDIYGEAVNIASRLEGIARPGEIVFSEALFLAMNKNEVPFVHLGQKKLKGVKYPVRIFRVKGHYDKIVAQRKAKRKRRRRLWFVLYKLFALAVIIALIFSLVWYMANYTEVLAGLL